MDRTAKAFRFRDIAITAYQEFGFTVDLSGSGNQCVRHRQRLGLSSQLSGTIAYRDVDWDNGRNEICEEAHDLLLIMVAESRASEHLGVSDDRNEKAMRGEEFANRLVRRLMQFVGSVEEPDYHARVEDYRHSPRNSSTRPRRVPLVSRQPE
jgi:hypothetical protein